ncbi:hypothetical protein [Streptomyces sp. H27-D2]|uniref:hypothetical protein n=1 Tax=Streptomyces sp. H27-D2 TaxID=3046304 RepID=UPI002DBDB87D|nr:hypothetical protein [Streptomyces sp. H27-D2]MEC4015069.1 hypothetical protein [Streptomyces sp. H27-D2]
MHEQNRGYNKIFDTDAGIAGLTVAVEHYARVFLPCEKKDCKHYRALTLEDAARSAGLLLRHDGQRHAHAESWVEEDQGRDRDRRAASLATFADELADSTEKLYKGLSFHGVHAVVEEAAEAVRKAGAVRKTGARKASVLKPMPLLRYDAALMLAWHLGVDPEEVWLRSGTDSGFRYLGCRSGHGKKTVTLGELPKPFQQLPPWQAEDILCIYRRVFGRLVGGKPLDKALFDKIADKRQRLGCGHRRCTAAC